MYHGARPVADSNGGTHTHQACLLLPDAVAFALAHKLLPPVFPLPCSAAMAVLRQQLTFVHELYESGGCCCHPAAQLEAPSGATCWSHRLLATSWLGARVPRMHNSPCVSLKGPLGAQSAGMVTEAQREDLLQQLRLVMPTTARTGHVHNCSHNIIRRHGGRGREGGHAGAAGQAAAPPGDHGWVLMC